MDIIMKEIKYKKKHFLIKKLICQRKKNIKIIEVDKLGRFKS